MAQFALIGENYLLLPLVLLPLLYFILKQFRASSKSKNVLPLPPGPTPWPLLGNIAQFDKFTPVKLAKIAQDYGPLFLLRFGSQDIVLGSSREAATEILKTQDKMLSARHIPEALPSELFKLEKGSMIWAETCDNAWNSLRTVCRAGVFSNKTLDAQSSLREKKITELIVHFRAKKGGVVDFGESVFATVFDMFSNAVFSTDLMGLGEDGGIKWVMRTLTEAVVTPNLSDFFPFLRKFDIQGLRNKTLKYVTKFRDVWRPIIEARRKKGDPLAQNDFLDFLLQNKFSHAQIDQLLTELFAAGVEGTAATIVWGMAELMKDPESMKKVREELDGEFGLEPVKESGLTKLPFFQACVKETLRLHPAVPLCIHRAPEATQMMNYRIPKDAKVVVNLWAVGRDPSAWDEPFKFKPERFLNSEVDFVGSNFGYIPFGAGRRICPGLPMAIRNVPLVLAAMLHSFDWTLPKGEDPLQLDMKEQFGLTMKKEKPLILIPTPRI